MARRSEGLSDRLKRIMYFLTSFSKDNGYAPNIREIGDSISVSSTSLIDYYLNQLEEQGYIARDKHIARSIRVLKPLYADGGNIIEAINDMLRIPIMGRIVASEPLPMPTSDLNYFDPESSVEIARSLLPIRNKGDELYALEVDGVSMIDAMVNDGDIVIMKRATEASNGEMVAVWLDDENSTTLKYFYKENGGIRLQPANPTMEPILVKNPDSLRIMGKVVMVIRQFKTI
ncbi:MAG TPA: transcriptional repressor LexA [Anaerolineaceae bacterium]